MGDRELITDLIMRYALALDTRDWALLGRCYTDDAVADFTSELRDLGIDAPPFEGREEIVRVTSAGLSGFESTQHVTTNVLVDVDDAGQRARSSAYVVAVHRDSVNRELLYVIGSVYDDEQLKVDEEWRFSRRRLRQLWTAGELSPEVQAALAGNVGRG